MAITTSLLDEFAAITGPKGIIRDAAEMQPYMKEWRGRVMGQSPCVLLPENTQQVAAMVKLCAKHKIPLVPQGGNTGLVGAGVPTADGSMITLSLKRLNKIRTVDADDFSMVAEAGCVLTTAKEAAVQKNRLLAMTLPSEGSASIGGLIATNAGGAYTLGYGNMREQVLGLEAVLADGSIVSELRSLRKNNSGYDLKQWLIGSEGTLGIITAATLKLLPQPGCVEAALIALPDAKSAIQALSLLRELTGDRLAAFELMPQLAIESAVRFVPQQRAPFNKSFPYLALIEAHANAPVLEQALEALLDKKMVMDAVPGESDTQIAGFWRLREAVVEAQRHLGASLKHDLSVPVGRMAEFLEKGALVAEKLVPGVRVYAFGHVGDGNIHFNLSQPEKMDADNFTARRENVALALHDLAISLGGSISAEHGIGRFKREEFHRTAQPAHLAMMRDVKRALDPDNILNPGALV
ncbi:MAG TPA: FAD-binding oxidoreductase [Alphaproteobacteria bacterium]|nr:FAD-binding oxidoreductase [Alphaproteobacteria bacterium]